MKRLIKSIFWINRVLLFFTMLPYCLLVIDIEFSMFISLMLFFLGVFQLGSCFRLVVYPLKEDEFNKPIKAYGLMVLFFFGILLWILFFADRLSVFEDYIKWYFIIPPILIAVYYTYIIRRIFNVYHKND